MAIPENKGTATTAALVTTLSKSLIDAFARKNPDTYGSRVIAEAEGHRGKTLEESLNEGWQHGTGDLITDGSIVCGRCKHTQVYAGECTYTGELVHFAECGGDPSNNLYTQRERYYVCMGCGHVCHYPPSET